MSEGRELETTRPQQPGPLRQWAGVLLTLVTIVAYDFAISVWPETPGIGNIFVLSTIFVAYWSGVWVGVFSALLVTAYIPVGAAIAGSGISENIERAIARGDYPGIPVTMAIAFGTLALLAVVVGVPVQLWRRARQRADEASKEAEREAEVRRAAEQRLSSAEALHGIVVDSSMDAIIIMDEHGVITLWNKSAERIFGWTSEEAVGTRLSETIIPREYRGEHEIGLERFRKTRMGPIFGQRLQFPALTKAGEQLDVELSVLPHDDGKETMFVGFVRDVTEERRTQRALAMAQRMESVGKLAGGVAHDFNNVLSVVIGYSELAKKKLAKDHPAQHDLDEVLVAARRSSEINSQLLSVARRRATEPLVLSLNKVVEGMQPMMTALIPEDIETKYVLSESLWPVEVDVGQIEQVLTNLVINARDAMPNGGRLVIETRNRALRTDAAPDRELPPGDYVAVSVTDTGVGVPYEIQDRIFEPFFTTKGEGGTGLGLATSYGIIKQAGGRLAVYSDPGHGSTFTVYLPRARTITEPSAALVGPTASLEGSETILVAEDNLQVRAMLDKTLRHYGYEVLSASSGQEALDVVKERPDDISLLVTDLIMPGMSGSELARQAREKNRNLRVIFLSGYSEEVVTSKGVDGVSGWFLQKPVMPTELATKVREILDAAKPQESRAPHP